jgi:oxygen-dependent protoporphyrinogen oxidase
MESSQAPKGRVIIVGGGFSGLTLAYELVKKNISVSVYEKQRWGGLISTDLRPEMQVESAANGFLNSFAVEDLCKDLGCELQGIQRQGRARFIFRQGLRRWPLGFKSTVILIFKILSILLFKRKQLKPISGESVEDWSLRILNQEALDYLVSPALSGIYAGDVSELSASLILGKMFERKPATNRELQSMGTVAPKLGMGEFIAKLVSHLLKNHVEMRMLGADETIAVLASDKLVFATEPWEVENSLARVSFAADFPQQEVGNFKRAFGVFRKLKVVPLIRVTVSFASPKFRIPGFGVLFPKKDQFQTLGVLANSQIFANRGEHYNESWILDGRNVNLPDAEVLESILSDRERAFGAKDLIFSHKITRWPKAISLYSTTHEKILMDFCEELSKNPCEQIFVTGNYLGKLGLAKILEQNQELAQQIANSRRNGTKS